MQNKFFCVVLNPNQFNGKIDFLIDDQWIIEIGIKNKNEKQIPELNNSRLLLDDIETRFKKRITLRLYGLLK